MSLHQQEKIQNIGLHSEILRHKGQTNKLRSCARHVSGYKKMKKAMFALSMLMAGVAFTACESDGLRGNVYTPDKTVDEIVNEVLDASEGDGWVYQCAVDLFKRQDGEWVYAGCGEVYMNLADDDSCNLWVEFDDEISKMPAYNTDDYGYDHKVQWHGEWYYF